MQELLIVMSPIVKGTIEDKIRLGLRMMDEGDTHMLKRDDLEFALRAMNRTLIFFGDTVSQSVSQSAQQGSN